ncbi:VrrA/YqfQ family protein [Bacillus weihaiensis]|uniref:VrrA/YqfQ family protein n=1 Tax=Bacillus weihaiensis TaxID=1547283 RepID=UPI002353AF2D|nr:VrrA/YqfQ family protein [Bacillus weihaiensis]
MFQQRPMPPMNARGFLPQQGNLPLGRQPFQGMYPNQQFGPQVASRDAGGLRGLLSRIIPGGSQGVGGAVNPQGIQGAANAVAGASRASGGIQGLMNPSNISGMLGNVQKVLGMAQQVTPMVQQYGPLVKNLPAMVKLYREIKNTDTDSDESSPSNVDVTNESEPLQFSQEEAKQTETKTVSKNELSKKGNDVVQQQPKKQVNNRARTSQPKMYI